ncbi:MAG: hypothetical protein ICV73_25475 [Acetobacteraceae bacterium]|nr:hypothetical protein [Acetobacteraceae bacterium]
MLAMAGLCGCAASELRPRHAVAISTEPAGAACLLTGGAEPIAELSATPAVVKLPQSPRDVRVFCTLAGHAPAIGTLPAELDSARLAAGLALTMVSPLAGASSGAIQYRYPPALNVVLPTIRFATARERDRFFAVRADESRRHFDQPIRAHKAMCRADEFGCQHAISEMERARDQELARIEALREAAAPAAE